MGKRFLSFVTALILMPSALAVADGFSMAGFELPNNHDWVNNVALERIQEKTGVAVTYKQYTDANEWSRAKAAMTADSSDLPDAFFKAGLTRVEMNKLYEKGVLIDLAPMLEEHAPNLYALLQAHPDWLQAISLDNGAIVALPNINELQNNNAIWINTTWLKRTGLKTPTTADELTAVLRAFKSSDCNNNGKADEVPLTFTGMWDLHWLAHAFGIVANDYHMTVKDGKAVSTLTSDENRAFLTWLHTLYTEGLIDHSGLTSPDSDRSSTEDNAVIRYGIVMGPSILNMLPLSQIANYDVLLPLTYNGTQTYRKLLHDVTPGTFAITSKCAEPEKLLEWADLFYSEEYMYLTQAGVLGKEYEAYSDGSWHWTSSSQVVAETVMPIYTIGNGSYMHGITTKEFQLKYDDPQTSRAVKQLAGLSEYAVYPFPKVWQSSDDISRINEIWYELGDYAEETMARFVTGDYELNDTTWAEYVANCEKLGLSEMISLWQKALD